MEMRSRKKKIQNRYSFLSTRQVNSISKHQKPMTQMDIQQQGARWLKFQEKFNYFQVLNQDIYSPDQVIDRKIIQIEEFEEIKKVLKNQKKNQPFRDEGFPPNNNSLCGQWKSIRKWQSIKWQKISDKIPNGQIFVNKPTPTDIKQGILGNCYFLAGLAALAERPHRIYSLFLNQKNQLNYFSLRILYKGRWKRIGIDEYIPYLGNEPAFSKSVDKQLWVILLEKAWAKLYTSYKRTQAGYPQEVLHDLTGAPIKILFPKNGSHNKDYEWKYLLKASQLQYSMVCSSKPGFDTNKSQSGIVQGHAYTLLNALQLNFEGKKVRLLQLRNPWGKVDFNGNWSDNDPIWKRVDKAQKKRINFKIGDDGIFFISFDDFWKEFTWIAIAEINDKASYLYCSCKDKKQGSYFAITINKAGVYSLQVDKTPQRSFQFQKQNFYNYPNATVDLIYKENDKCTKIQGFNSRNRITQQKYKMKPGTYIVKVKIDFDSDWEQDYDVNLAIYAQYPCTIDLASKQEILFFEQQQKETEQIYRMTINTDQIQRQIQVTQIQELISIQKLNELKRQGKPFIDKEFLPNNSSLCGQWTWESSQKNSDDKAWQKTRKRIKWFKINDKIANSKLYVDKTNPNDIIQGSIGDCYFLAGLAALAQRPDRIFRIFLEQERNQSNYYSVRILYKGKWERIDMDQFIPFEKNQPAFSKSVDKQLWVILLEKAWAKLYGSYKRIEAGFSEQPLHDLTGAPIVMLLRPQNNLERKQHWQYLLKASKLEYSMVCSSNPGSDTNITKTGIVLGHAYTLLNATYLDYKGKRIQLLQIRNPWGQGQFKRDWADQDKKWKQIPQSQKDRIGFKEIREDGIFFISFDDFWKEFQEITIAEINDNASYVYKSFKDPKKQGCYFKIEIAKQGNYSLQVDKTPQRYFEYKDWQNFEYPNAVIGFGSLTNGKFKKIQEFQSADRTTCKTFKMNPGTYIAKVNIDFISKWEQDYEVNLAIYAEFPCTIGLASKQEAVKYEGKNVKWIGIQQTSKTWSFIGPDGSTSKDMSIWKL